MITAAITINALAIAMDVYTEEIVKDPTLHESISKIIEITRG